MRSLIGPMILVALAAWCGVLSLRVEPSGLTWVSLDAPLPAAVGVSRYTFVEPDGGFRGVALRMNRSSGQLDTACVFLPGGAASLAVDPKCTKLGAGVPVRLSWQLLDGGSVTASGKFTTGDPVGSLLDDDAAPTYLLGGDFELRKGHRYTLILRNDAYLSALAAANPHLIVRLDVSDEGPLITQALEQLGASVLGLIAAVWGAVAVFSAYRRSRRPQPEH